MKVVKGNNLRSSAVELTAARSYETKFLMWFSFSFLSCFCVCVCVCVCFFNSSDFVQLRLYVIDRFKEVSWWKASVLQGLMQLLFASG